MIPATVDECNKEFSATIKLNDLYYSTILDCHARSCNVFTKILSEKKIAVFGEYKILIFYRKTYLNEEKKYEAITVRKNICEIIPFEVRENAETTAVLLLQPFCNFKYVLHDHNPSFWEIEVKGEIKVTSTMNTTAEITDNTEPAEEQPVISQPQESEEQPADSNVWQFDENDEISIEQLMDMDLESLKNMGK